MQNRNTQIQVAIAIAVVVLVLGYMYLYTNTSVSSETETQSDAYSTQQQTQNPSSAENTTSVNPQSMNTVTLETNKGTIVFETFNQDAPKAVNNFITLAQKGFYDNLIFHRVINGFMIQGGDPNGNGTGGPGYKFEDELDPNTPSAKLGYQKGTVAMANAGPNTNGSQFFIMLENVPLPHAYTIFGRVISGQDVVDAIGQVPTGANDKPVTPVVIQKVMVK